MDTMVRTSSYMSPGTCLNNSKKEIAPCPHAAILTSDSMLPSSTASVSAGIALIAIRASSFCVDNFLPPPRYRQLHIGTPSTSIASKSQDINDDGISDGFAIEKETEEIMDDGKDKVSGIFPIEVSIDGSLLVVLPAVGIALLGIITSVMVVANSSDPILAPPGTNEAAQAEGRMLDNEVDQLCRGFCSSQEEQLDKMRSFMNNIPTKTNMEKSSVEI